MDKEKINYFIYVRKSSEDKERQALSHEGQLTEIQKIVERENLTIVEIYKESKSAHIPDNRPLFNEMLKRIQKGEANGIIAWHTNRLSRNPKEAGIIQQLLQDEVIKSILVPYRQFRSEDNALLFSIEASEANQYSRDLKVAVKRGLQQKVAMGQPPLIARLGYLNTKLAEHGSNSIVVDHVRWPLMRKAFDLMLTRQFTMLQITSILNNDYNFRTRSSKKRVGGPLAISVLHRAFTDPFYAGYFNYMGKVHKGSYKPMITLEEYDTIQAILGRKIKASPHKHEFAFTGFITCGCCGCAVTASKKLKKTRSTGEYKTYAFYHCTKRKGSAVCEDKKYTTKQEMEAMIINELEKVILVPRWKEWVFETIKEDYEDELLQHRALLKSTRDYEQKLLSELDTLLDLRISNELTEEKYKHKKAERESLLIRVQEKCKKLEKNVNDWIEQLDGKLNFSETAVEKFKSGDPKLQKGICNDIGWNWTLKAKKLMFSRHLWFTPIEELKNYYDRKKAWLEPIKTYEEYRQSLYYQEAHPIVCRLRESIRTENDYSRKAAYS